MKTGWSSVTAIAGSFLLAGMLRAQVPGQPPPSQEPEEEPVEATLEPLELPYSPRGAFFRSMAIPGWGQAHVGATGRGAVYFTMAAGSFWMTYLARQQLADAKREQEWLRASGLLQETEESDFVLARSQHFEDWAALSIFLMFLSGADAYVSAYLSDFEDRMGVMPGPSGELRIETRIPFTVGR